MKPILEKVLLVINNDRMRLQGLKTAGIDDTRLTVENLGDLAGNHLFDDYPTLFGITELEGHTIRAFFQCVDYFTLAFVNRIRSEWGFFDTERKEFLEKLK
ncbi:MAG: hypothetical protein IMZ64_06550 [Bacteroidetes bacterium]|nr:hypothetical protein [Bacteroidota bacterium]